MKKNIWVRRMEKKNIGLYYVRYMFLAAVITVGVLCLTAFFMYKTNLSTVALGILLVLCYILPNFIAGWKMGKRAEKRQFLWGLFIGIGYFLVLFLVSFLGNGYFVEDVKKLILIFFLCAGSGMFGGMLS